MNFKSNYASYINEYIKLKQSLGYKFNTEINVLKRFDNFIYENNINDINIDITEQIILANPNWSINNKSRNITAINGFCNYLINNHIIKPFTISKQIYKQQTRKYKPYIFSYIEIKNIVYYADNFYSKSNFEMKYIMSFLIRLLYGTGMRLGEALCIKKDNINYKDGNMFRRSTIETAFYKILKICNIKRTDQGPRVHDLRFTFITHSFNEYIKTGKDPLYFLPLLMTYVGHKSISSTEYYLKTTSETLNYIRKISEENHSYLIKGYDTYE